MADAVTDYCDELLLALRLRDVPGERIGAILAEVRAHLADSGEDPAEAFGTPTAYAEALSPNPPVRRVARTALIGAGSFLAAWCLAEATTALVRGEPADLGPVPVLAAIAIAFVTPWLIERLARRGRGATVMLALITAIFVGVIIAVLALAADQWSIAIPAPVLLVAAIVLFALVGRFGWARPDPVRPPTPTPTPPPP